MEFKNQKPLSQIQSEKELSQMPMSDVHRMIAQMNADLTAFFDHYFTQFPDQE